MGDNNLPYRNQKSFNIMDILDPKDWIHPENNNIHSCFINNSVPFITNI